MYKNKIFRNVSVFVKGSVELVWTPEAETGRSYNQKFIVHKGTQKYIYPARQAKTGAGRHRWRRHWRMLRSGKNLESCCAKINPDVSILA